MSTKIHPMAVVDKGAELDEGVVVGPYAVIGPQVRIASGTQIDAAAQLRGPTDIGHDNHIYSGACVGFEPQDLKYEGEEESFLTIGSRNRIREYTTINRGTKFGGGTTSLGDDNLLMAYVHIGHDCHVGSRAVFVNNATLGGHVDVHDDVTIAAFSSVHQFCRIGRHAYVGGYSVITRDALPFVKTVGIRPACYGINRIGLERKGFAPEQLKLLETAYRILVRSKLSKASALERLREMVGNDDVAYFTEFVATSDRGLIKDPPGREGSRGGDAE
jgi:UDP-N-acetylglucosamine acyltransferase